MVFVRPSASWLLPQLWWSLCWLMRGSRVSHRMRILLVASCLFFSFLYTLSPLWITLCIDFRITLCESVWIANGIVVESPTLNRILVFFFFLNHPLNLPYESLLKLRITLNQSKNQLFWITSMNRHWKHSWITLGESCSWITICESLSLNHTEWITIESLVNRVNRFESPTESLLNHILWIVSFFSFFFWITLWIYPMNHF